MHLTRERRGKYGSGNKSLLALFFMLMRYSGWATVVIWAYADEGGAEWWYANLYKEGVISRVVCVCACGKRVGGWDSDGDKDVFVCVFAVVMVMMKMCGEGRYVCVCVCFTVGYQMEFFSLAFFYITPVARGGSRSKKPSRASLSY